MVTYKNSNHRRPTYGELQEEVKQLRAALQVYQALLERAIPPSKATYTEQPTRKQGTGIAFKQAS